MGKRSRKNFAVKRNLSGKWVEENSCGAKGLSKKKSLGKGVIRKGQVVGKGLGKKG